MQKTQNNITLIAIFVVLVLIIIAGYSYMVSHRAPQSAKAPVECGVNDNFSIVTGKPCPGFTPSVTASTSITTEGSMKK